VPFEVLRQYTSLAHLGLTLDKADNINYRLSLPNKLFDYIHAGLPILASDLPEIRKIIDHYHIGTFIESHTPEHIAQKIVYIFNHPDLYNSWKKNLPAAAADLCWQKEEKKLVAIFDSLTS
jgi:glycosyltransferase involved in cell wall biosynthesis